MKIDVNNALTIILGLITLIGSIYRLAQVEATINAKINKVENNVLSAVDQLKDGLVDRLYVLEKKVDIHLTEYNEKKTFIEYRLHGNEELIKHKFGRLASWIKQMSGYLHNQSGFQMRDDEY